MGRSRTVPFRANNARMISRLLKYSVSRGRTGARTTSAVTGTGRAVYTYMRTSYNIVSVDGGASVRNDVCDSSVRRTSSRPPRESCLIHVHPRSSIFINIYTRGIYYATNDVIKLRVCSVYMVYRLAAAVGIRCTHIYIHTYDRGPKRASIPRKRRVATTAVLGGSRRVSYDTRARTV